MTTLENFTRQLATYLTPELINQIHHAYHYAEQAHAGQYRYSGEPYITHPLAAAMILAELRMDHQTLIAAMLHDVLEDVGVNKKIIKQEFGKTIADLVDGVSKLEKIKFESRAEAQAENLRKMILAMSKDIRVILVKLADRLHNMRTLGVLRSEKRQRIAKETLEIYAPLANRLGMHSMKVEFEELGFSALYPMRYSLIKKAVNAAREVRKEPTAIIKQQIESCLNQHQLHYSLISHQRHLYSIYRKMQAKTRLFSELMDVLAFKVIVENVDDCYKVLGAVHNLYKPLPGRFKDHIAIPKANGYQSLHTVLFGPQGMLIEVQIRTKAMDIMANHGIAAHWLYKSDHEAPDSAHAKAHDWLKSLIDMQQRAHNSLEFIENVKTDLFPREIFVFTPKGSIIVMPKGATPVDFAYAIHTDVGSACVAAKVNRRLVSLSDTLESGQTVEIITAANARVNPDWLNFVVTGKARSNIRHFLKSQRRSDSVELGKRLLDQSLARLASSIKNVPEHQLQRVLHQANLAQMEDLLEDIGLGNRVPQLVAWQMVGDKEDAIKKAVNNNAPLNIRGTEGIVVTYAPCCHPIPGDNIVGLLRPNQGIIVHLDNCLAVTAKKSSDQYVPVRWSSDVNGEFLVALKLELENHKGVLAALAGSISAAEANIEDISTERKDSRFSVANIVISVRDRIHLARVIRRIRTLKAVLKISRVKDWSKKE